MRNPIDRRSRRDTGAAALVPGRTRQLITGTEEGDQ
jgi:hypothetical protein